MDELFERFARAVDGMAGLNGYQHTGRHQEWLDRLEVNLPELNVLDALRPQPELGYLTQPHADITSGGIPISHDDDDSGGIAAIARAARAAPARAGESAKSALAAARQQNDLRAFISLADEKSLDESAASAARCLREGAPMPLMGVPIAIKDLMAVAGFPQTDGSGGPMPQPSTHDAEVVARLRNAGALVIGTTNLHELAYGITSQNPHHGWVVNPRGSEYIPGGSSGGSAAAVAAGIVRLALGTDTAGSIRLPASCCGVVGFKPSFDAVPRNGAQTLGASLDHIGPIAASVADAALAYSIMAGQHASTVSNESLAGIRVGVPRNYFFDPLSADVARAVSSVLERMRDDGAELVEIDLPGVENSAALQFVTLCSEATDHHWKRLCEQPETLGADVRVRLEMGQFLPATWYVRAQRGRAALAAMFETASRGVDVLLTPTLRIEPPRFNVSAPKIGNRTIPLHTAITSLTMPFNLTGMPALTMPCGNGDNGLPIGVQIAGRRGDDWRVLNVSARLETILATNPWRRIS